jgi:voltage-gated potassium channel Kch
MGLAVIVLGTIGFQREHSYAGEGVFDSFYRALGLFGLGGAVTSPPVTLQIARLLGPIFVGLAAIQGLIALSRGQLQLLWFRVFLRGHAVVVGLGYTGSSLARSFDAAGYRVVVVEADMANPAIEGCRERGIPVLIGDATDVKVLESIACAHADLVVATSGEDGRNIDIATAVMKVAGRRGKGVLTVLVHLDNPELWRALRAEELSGERKVPARLDFFNVNQAAADMILDDFPPFPAAAGEPTAGSHTLVIVGFEGLGESLVLQAAALWRGARKARSAAFRIVLLGPSADEDRETLLARYPSLSRICDICARSSPLDARIARQDLDLDLDDGGRSPVIAVYVCLWNEGDSLSAALALRQRNAFDGDVPIVVAIADDEAGVGKAVRDGGGILETVDAFGVLSAVLTPELLLIGIGELLARAKHADYVQDELAHGRGDGSNPSLKPWSQLDESLRVSNRRFADHIGAKIKEADCRLVPAPLIDPETVTFRFSDEEIDALAIEEHERWERDLLREGWRHGGKEGPDGRLVKDPERMLQPLIGVAWEDLEESEKEKDRGPIRRLPQMLARVGFEMVPTSRETREREP